MSTREDETPLPVKPSGPMSRAAQAVEWTEYAAEAWRKAGFHEEADVLVATAAVVRRKLDR